MDSILEVRHLKKYFYFKATPRKKCVQKMSLRGKIKT